MNTHVISNLKNNMNDWSDFGLVWDRDYPAIDITTYTSPPSYKFIGKPVDNNPIMIDLTLAANPAKSLYAPQMYVKANKTTNTYLDDWSKLNPYELPSGNFLFKSNDSNGLVAYIFNNNIYVMPANSFRSTECKPVARKVSFTHFAWSEADSYEAFTETGWNVQADYFTGSQAFWASPWSYTYKTLPNEANPLQLTGVGHSAADENGAFDLLIKFELKWWECDTAASLPITTDLTLLESQLQMNGTYTPKGIAQKQYVVGCPIWKVTHTASEEHDFKVTEYHITTHDGVASIISGIPTSFTVNFAVGEFYTTTVDNIQQWYGGFSVGATNDSFWHHPTFNKTESETNWTWKEGADEVPVNGTLVSKFVGYYLGPKVQCLVAQIQTLS